MVVRTRQTCEIALPTPVVGVASRISGGKSADSAGVRYAYRLFWCRDGQADGTSGSRVSVLTRHGQELCAARCVAAPLAPFEGLSYVPTVRRAGRRHAGGTGNTTLEGMGSAQGGGWGGCNKSARRGPRGRDARGAWKPPGSAACVALAWGVWLVRVEPKGWSEAAASRERRFRRVWSGAWAASGGRARIGLIRSSEKCGLDKWWTGRTRTSAGDAKVRRPKGETRRRKGSRTRHVEEQSGKTDRRGEKTAGTS